MTEATPHPLLLGGTVVLAVAAVSTAAPLIRLASAPALPIAFWRLLLATVLLLPPTLWWHHRDLRTLQGRDLLLLGGVGVILALHFATWIASLELTSVAASVVLVTMHPVLVGLASHRFFDEGLGPRAWVGVVVAIGGAALIAYGDHGLGGHRLLGDALALAGAVAMAAYLIAGRGIRQRLPLLPYVLVVYGAATATLALLVLANGEAFLGYPRTDYAIFLALALVPMILGHTLFNWSLRFVQAPVISTSILGEPVGSTILALLVLGEVPPSLTVAGGVVVLAGIWLVARDRAPGRGAP